MKLKDMAKKYEAHEFKAEAMPGPKPIVEISVTFMRGGIKYKHISLTSPDPEELDKVDKKIQEEINKPAPNRQSKLKK